jgi:rhodanese-related sulfurtransferase
MTVVDLRTGEHPALAPVAAAAHFAQRLATETDPDDLHTDLGRGAEIVVLDARAPDAYRRGHLPGARSLPHRLVDAESTARLPRDALLVVYCAGPGCNAATKAAAKLSALGFAVKELIGGIEYWERSGYEVIVEVR